MKYGCGASGGFTVKNVIATILINLILTLSSLSLSLSLSLYIFQENQRLKNEGFIQIFRLLEEYEESKASIRLGEYDQIYSLIGTWRISHKSFQIEGGIWSKRGSTSTANAWALWRTEGLLCEK